MTVANPERSTLHLFRALLRAASYLPDEFAQTYIRNYIIQRFRTSPQATRSRLESARNGLSILLRANNGATRPLMKVLMLTYGRAGKRRRELVGVLYQLKKDPQHLLARSMAIEEFEINIQHEDTEVYRHLLLALMKSQAQRADGDTPRRKIRYLEPRIPEENIWGRTLPPVRRRNIIRRFWAETLEKILPPLSDAEWNRLRDLATGIIPFKGAPPRRSHPQPAPEALLTADALKLPIQDPARNILKQRHHIIERHHITSRFMRRIWGDIWGLTPKIFYDNESPCKNKKGTWVVTWGGGRSANSQGMFSVPGRRDLELFEGVD